MTKLLLAILLTINVAFATLKEAVEYFEQSKFTEAAKEFSEYSKKGSVLASIYLKHIYDKTLVPKDILSDSDQTENTKRYNTLPKILIDNAERSKEASLLYMEIRRLLKFAPTAGQSTLQKPPISQRLQRGRGRSRGESIKSSQGRSSLTSSNQVSNSPTLTAYKKLFTLAQNGCVRAILLTEKLILSENLLDKLHEKLRKKLPILKYSKTLDQFKIEAARAVILEIELIDQESVAYINSFLSLDPNQKSYQYENIKGYLDQMSALVAFERGSFRDLSHFLSDYLINHRSPDYDEYICARLLAYLSYQQELIPSEKWYAFSNFLIDRLQKLPRSETKNNTYLAIQDMLSRAGRENHPKALLKLADACHKGLYGFTKNSALAETYEKKALDAYNDDKQSEDQAQRLRKTLEEDANMDRSQEEGAMRFSGLISGPGKITIGEGVSFKTSNSSYHQYKKARAYFDIFGHTFDESDTPAKSQRQLAAMRYCMYESDHTLEKNINELIEQFEKAIKLYQNLHDLQIEKPLLETAFYLANCYLIAEQSRDFTMVQKILTGAAHRGSTHSLILLDKINKLEKRFLPEKEKDHESKPRALSTNNSIALKNNTKNLQETKPLEDAQKKEVAKEDASTTSEPSTLTLTFPPIEMDQDTLKEELSSLEIEEKDEEIGWNQEAFNAQWAEDKERKEEAKLQKKYKKRDASSLSQHEVEIETAKLYNIPLSAMDTLENTRKKKLSPDIATVIQSIYNLHGHKVTSLSNQDLRMLWSALDYEFSASSKGSRVKVIGKSPEGHLHKLTYHERHGKKDNTLPEYYAKFLKRFLTSLGINAKGL